ncbi:MAG: hypothetical protein ACI9JR_002847 [Gammaproteobacteria bacterium]|jgi:hypothetical protein
MSYNTYEPTVVRHKATVHRTGLATYDVHLACGGAR